VTLDIAGRRYDAAVGVAGSHLGHTTREALGIDRDLMARRCLILIAI
jgi:hypothetical protein